jgi:hypothetical protein
MNSVLHHRKRSFLLILISPQVYRLREVQFQKESIPRQAKLGAHTKNMVFDRTRHHLLRQANGWKSIDLTF